MLGILLCSYVMFNDKKYDHKYLFKLHKLRMEVQNQVKILLGIKLFEVIAHGARSLSEKYLLLSEFENF